MKNPIFKLLAISVFLVMGITGCGALRGFIQDDPIRNMIAATLPVTPRPATSAPKTPTPEPYSDNGPFILMLDDFSDPNSGWEVHSNEYGSTAYEDGGYLVKAFIIEEYFWGVAGKNYENIRMDVDVEVLQTNYLENDAFGVDCRLQDNGDGYGFRISSDGYALIEKFVDGKAVDLMEWIETEAIFTDGRVNQLTAICEGDHLSLLVNGEPVAEIVDDTFTEGDIALSAISFEDEPVSVKFDNIVVQEIGNPYLYADEGEYELTITNPTTFEICQVFIVPSYEDFWGTDYLETGDVLTPGESRTFTGIVESLVDVRTETCQNLTISENYEVDVSDGLELTLEEPVLLLHQPFTDTEGWPSGVVDGGMISNSLGDYYSVSVTEAEKLVTASSDFNRGDVVIHADASLVKAGSNDLGLYGVTCRMQKDGSGVFFAIRGDGMASIIKLENDQMIELTDWKATDYINPGIASNFIEAYCQGSSFTFFVNGDYIGWVEDAEFETGLVGVAVYSPAGQTTQADFDFLDVYQGN